MEIEKKYLLLARKWLDGTATPDERQEFSDWYNRDQDSEVLIPAERGNSDEQYRERILSGIRQKTTQESRVIPFWRRPFAAAALLLIGVGIGYYVYRTNNFSANSPQVAASTDVAPGGDRATLTLGDGRTLELDQLADGAVQQGEGFLIKKENGQLIYEITRSGEKAAYNVIRTPRGGQFKVVLPDGSKVWLNAESSLKYPVYFGDDERFVALKGEGYFEVAKASVGGKSIPFRVNVNDQETVEVLGTHFNIMAYTNEAAIKTTLLEGSVRVSTPGAARGHVLKPGQQSILQDKADMQLNTKVDVDEAISWKNGLISYKDADIQTIMRQIERWYDVKVIYSGNIPSRSFTGGISRQSQLSTVLKVLELNGIHFEMKDRQITVLP